MQFAVFSLTADLYIYIYASVFHYNNPSFIAEVDKIQRVSGPNTVSILLTEVYKSYNTQYRYDRIKQAWIIYLRSNACGSQNKHIDFCK